MLKITENTSRGSMLEKNVRVLFFPCQNVNIQSHPERPRPVAIDR